MSKRALAAKDPAFLAFLALSTFLVACGEGAPPTATQSTTAQPTAPDLTTGFSSTSATGTSQAAGPVQDACALLSAEQVQDGLNTAPLTPEAVDTADAAGRGPTACDYREGEVLRLQVTTVSIDEAAGRPEAMVDIFVASYGSSVRVDGIGDAAAYYGDEILGDGVIFVVDNDDTATQVNLDLPEHRPDVREELVELARTAAAAV